jgi:large subunit ribosomal protein L33
MSSASGGFGGARPVGRVPISLACSECKARNYKTTKSAADTEPIELKKFCKQCKKHTLHRETK